MNRFAALVDRLAYEPRRNAKIALVRAYLAEAPDPDRGYALAALTGGLDFPHAKPNLVRALIAERTDPVLFALSYDYVGDLSETVALMWPGPGPGARSNLPPPGIAEVVETLRAASRLEIPRLIAGWLDRLDEAGRFALLKLITGALRIGVSARLAKTALARLGGREPDEVEEVWHGLEPPYGDLFAWIEGRGARPSSVDPAPFRPPMLAHALEERDVEGNDPALFRAEWKWDGIRVQAAAGLGEDGRPVARLFSRSGDDISQTFPDLLERLAFDGAIDGELLVVIDGRVQPFATLQQRLNRKTVTPKLLADMPAAIRAYDLLAEGGEDLRALPFDERRARLEAFVARLGDPLIDLSPMIPFASWDELAAARADPATHGAGGDADAVEGVMIKRALAPYVPGRPKGEWFKWKRDPFNVDAVLMYAQRGHGKRSSFYSDYTFGVWREAADGRELVPVGKAYFGFTDEELKTIDKFVRTNTVNRFGPVREVTHTAETGLVIEVAFEGLNRSTRHKSGVAMRFPRVARLRWDKRPAEADTLQTLLALLPEG
ncbi:cisplatin damage response ATP-dependent DNA ligase [Mongoliimonas terrestris]|uniref:cisplatin damage response ATP-dependent DNA ligase n=1 Tax=Mongoliimonas terrestris TaxID=1709001 RepID=UPI0009499891|nr:cisplatin damage response ATP-dependent DNA ligase [Mongoliimonas terrestris]